MSATMIKVCEFESFRIPKPITSDAENEMYTEKLLALDRRGHLTAAEKAFAELLTHLIEVYEEKRYPIRDASPREVLNELMLANDMKQKDLVPYLGSESVVSSVLSGHRELSKAHIRNLSKRFH